MSHTHTTYSDTGFFLKINIYETDIFIRQQHMSVDNTTEVYRIYTSAIFIDLFSNTTPKSKRDSLTNERPYDNLIITKIFELDHYIMCITGHTIP